MNSKFKYDYFRVRFFFPKGSKAKIDIFTKSRLMYMYIARAAEGKKVRNRLFKLILKVYGRKFGLEFQTDNIGVGFSRGHAFCITINDYAQIGNNCSIAKGATIGQTASDFGEDNIKAPIIGNEVWIGVNATIVGDVKIGNNVLIAPNAYVNFDVPSNSVVIGNPGEIHKKENATDLYIINKIKPGVEEL